MIEEIKNIVYIACVTLIVTEIIYYLTPKDKVIDCIYSLLYTVVLSFLVLSAVNMNWDFSQYSELDNPYQDEIDEQINQYYKLETEKEMQELVEDALSILNITCENTETIISVTDEDVIIHSIKITLSYESDIDNAKVILKEIFGTEIPLEVVGEN